MCRYSTSSVLITWQMPMSPPEYNWAGTTNRFTPMAYISDATMQASVLFPSYTMFSLLISRQHLLNLCLEIRRRHGAHIVGHRLAALEDHEGRDAGDAVSLG